MDKYETLGAVKGRINKKRSVKVNACVMHNVCVCGHGIKYTPKRENIKNVKKVIFIMKQNLLFLSATSFSQSLEHLNTTQADIRDQLRSQKDMLEKVSVVGFRSKKNNSSLIF